MIDIRYLGELGNWLFQYSLARIVSDRTGMALRAKGLRGFEGTFEKVPGRIYRWRRKQVLTDANFCMNHLPEDAPIRLHGYFQKLSFYTGYPVREWLRIDSLTHADPHDVVMHVRLGDYCKLGQALDPSYYLEALRRARPRALFLCTDSPGHPMLRAFAPFNPTLVDLDTLETFRFIKSFRRIILSQSTFSWWAAWLSDATEIYFPSIRTHPRLVNWVNGDMIPDEDRYRVIGRTLSAGPDSPPGEAQ